MPFPVQTGGGIRIPYPLILPDAEQWQPDARRGCRSSCKPDLCLSNSGARLHTAEIDYPAGIDLNRVYVNGASQGGGLGLVCCALNPDLISKASILYPFLSDFQKVWELGADEIAYEGLRYYTRWFDATGERTNEVFTKLGYVDVVSFASRVRCEVLFGTGLSDNICPPQTQMAVWNQLSCPKRHIFFPDFGHEEIQEFDDLLLNYYFEENTK